MFSEGNKKLFKNTEIGEADVREDVEQVVKLEEILEMLVSAGYYRARIKGLANFDKIVGGMTWCIESCYFDIDIDLLFKENLTIGQKISLTEKIVAMLPKMNCPHRIEPHQIQGLDCIHIYSVMQWLVNESMKMRKEMAESVREFAVTQFDKKHTFESRSQVDNSEKMNLCTAIKLIKNAYEPRRHFEQKDVVLKDEFSIVSNTLLEYGDVLNISQSVINKLQETKNHHTLEDKQVIKEIIDTKIQEKEKVEKLMKNLSKFDDNMTPVSSNIMEKIVNMHAREVANAAEQYTVMSASKSENDDSPSTQITIALQKQKTILENKLERLSKSNTDYKREIIELKKRINDILAKKQSIDQVFEKLKDTESNVDPGLAIMLEKILIVHENLKSQENKFREQCRLDLSTYSCMFDAEVQDKEHREGTNHMIEYEEQKETVNRLRLQLARINRAIAILTRQLDDIPGRSELTQYQRRFLELYNQVSAKHKETKQYYTLYNTLDDTKLYLNKELSLLNSIQDNYIEAMASSSGREQFIKQFEMIVDGVQKNKRKVEKRFAEEKNRRDALSSQLLTMMDQQRKYVAAVRQLTIECRENETLLSRLRGP